MFKVTGGLAFLVALWFFASPWVYGAYHNADSWNSWIVGGVMAIIAASRAGSSTRAAASAMWVNVVLAVWVFFSPWIYGYTANSGRLVNSLCVGVVMFVLSIMASRIQPAGMSQTTVTHRM
jgi:hypothetical protein